MHNPKLKSSQDITQISQKLKKEGKVLVTTNGTFDILHSAHFRLLEKCKKLGDVLIVLINSDLSVKKFKGDKRPIFTEKERAYNLASTEAVDYIVIFNEDNPLNLLRKIKAQIHAKGGAFIPERIKEEEDLVCSWGGKFKHFELEEGYSSTNVIEKVLDVYGSDPNTTSSAAIEELKIFDRNKLKIKPLSKRVSKSKINDILVKSNTKTPEIADKNLEKIINLASSIKKAKKGNHPIIFSFGAHFIKNGLSLLLIELMKKGYVTHILGNGAVSIHDWELSYLGKTEEDVIRYIKEGQFGLWDETGKYLNHALVISGREGYGKAIGKMIWEEKLDGEKLKHPHKTKSILGMAYKLGISASICPGIGYDIIHTHPACDGASLGKAAYIDFLKIARTIQSLKGGVYISIGSAITSPMVFEKSLSMANNIAIQKSGKPITNFKIFVNDIQPGDWDWKKSEPPKDNPAYYLRFNKSFSRMGGDFEYLQLDNRDFLLNLHNLLK